MGVLVMTKLDLNVHLPSSQLASPKSAGEQRRNPFIALAEGLIGVFSIPFFF